MFTGIYFATYLVVEIFPCSSPIKVYLEFSRREPISLGRYLESADKAFNPASII
jgi:hypothetical protein